MPLCSLEEALEEMRAGRLLIVVDDEQRENEGDLVMAAEKVTPEAVNFIVKQARGLLCMPMLGERLDELQMPLMITENGGNKNQTAFTVSVDYKKNTTTGISAHDRGGHGPGADRPGGAARGLHPAGPSVPAAILPRRRAGSRRAYRSYRRPLQLGGNVSRRDSLRDHGRRRLHVTLARLGGVR